MKRRYHSKTIYIKLNVIPQKDFQKLKLWHCTNIKVHLIDRYPKQKGNEEMKEMITNAKTKRRKNLLSRQLSMCFKNGQHAKNNVIIISTQAFTCTMYTSIDVNGKKKKRKLQTSRSKAPPYFVYNSASLWFTCCFHFTFSSCSRDASAVNCKQGTKLK